MKFLYGLLHMDMSVGQPAKTNNYYLCADTGCHLEDFLRVMAAKDG